MFSVLRKSGSKSSTTARCDSTHASLQASPSVNGITLSRGELGTVIESLTDLTEVACEYQENLNLIQLINLIDLYRAYLDTVSGSSSFNAEGSAADGQREVADFHRFVRDEQLLEIAAAAAERQCGSAVAVPTPLQLPMPHPIRRPTLDPVEQAV